MAVRKSQPDSSARKALRRFFLSAFVVVSFAAYALHKPSGPVSGSSQGESSGASGSQALDPGGGSTATASTSAPAQDPAGSTPTAPPPTGAPTAVASSGLKDGSYTGQQTDAYYGTVQVQAVIQGGKLTNVQFLQYPADRRTSQRINSIAIPYLQQEAIQAQSANVDIISGATLTSQAFAESLQTALDQAK